MGLFNLQRKSEQGFHFRPMAQHHVAPALDIIYAHDEDDGEEAQESFTGDLSGKYVVEIDGQLAGLSGYTRIMEAPSSAWLSWTYVNENFRRQGIGSYLIAELCNILKKRKVERLFISTSDYKEDGVDIYADARRFYENFGARCDVKLPNFYQKEETKYIYRLLLGEQISSYFDSATTDNAVRFVDIDFLDETQSAYCLLWEEQKKSSSNLDNMQENEEILTLTNRAISEGTHAIFASLPAPQSREASMALQRAGFKKLGAVIDYYGPGHDDVYWGYYPTEKY